jgi:NAD(P)-dependent dehydrogenase (short-subunit alcohol dehydrogenase family)
VPGRIAGKVALVTGGASGIGRATALTFAREGAKLVIADMNEDGGQQTVHMITENGGEATFVRTDVSKAVEVQALISQAVATYGRLDCAHNNAGKGSGTIVNTASIMGLVGSWSGTAAYNASKHGVVGLTKTAALEYATSGIRVNAVCPGYIHTPLIEEALTSNPALEAQIVARHPVGRMGEPEEIAEAVVWLCSDAASFVTGHTMTVDGGYVAQ